MRRLILCLAVLLPLLIGPSVASASRTDFTFNFDLSELTFSPEKGFERVSLTGATALGDPGHPQLPIKFVQIAIPTSEEVERAEILSTTRQELVGEHNVYPAQPMVEMSRSNEEIEFVPAEPKIYNLSTEYPGKLVEVLHHGFMAGQHIVSLALHPVQYTPAEGKLVLHTEIRLRLIFKPASRQPVPVNRRSASAAEMYSERSKRMVINPEDVQIEQKQASGAGNQGDIVEFLIIVRGSEAGLYANRLRPLANWKRQRGISTEIVGLNEILEAYEGDDTQEEIRNCIKDYYSNKETQFVLLVGDTVLIPCRLTDFYNYKIPTDLYYSDLDGDWNALDDEYYGGFEDQVDLYPDVYVGRAPITSWDSAEVFVNKCLLYEKNPPEGYTNRLLLVAPWLWPGWDGAEIKNAIDGLFIPDWVSTTKLYESLENLTHDSLEYYLNQGQNIINHVGHGNENGFRFGLSSSWYWENTDMDALENDGLFGLFYSGSCKSAAIDRDCPGEHWVNNESAGGVAYCGNTRRGWSVPGGPLFGPAPELDMEFFRALYQDQIFRAGKTLAESKIPLIPKASHPGEFGLKYRENVYGMLLLGDPTLELWTDTLGTFDESMLSYDSVYVGRMQFTVNMLEDDALVSCVKKNPGIGDDVMWGTAHSSGGRAVVFFDSPATSGQMAVTITKHNYRPYTAVLNVTSPSSPHVVYESHQIDDSPGNDNDVVNPGDEVLLWVTAKNIGTETAFDVAGFLTEDDTLVTVTQSQSLFGSMAPDSTAQNQSAFVFTVAPLCPDSHAVIFTLELDDGDAVWTSHLSSLVVESRFTVQVHPSDSDTKGTVIGSPETFAILVDDPVGGFVWPVELSSDLPETVVSFSPPEVTPPGLSAFTVLPDESMGVGIHSVTVAGTSYVGTDTLHDSVELTLFVRDSVWTPGETWYVSTTGHDEYGLGTQQLPFRTIQTGIDSASRGDTVLVEAGVYEERIDFDGKTDIVVASYHLIDGDENHIHTTIIDGGMQGTVVRFESGEDTTSVLHGFTIRNGFQKYGGGIRIIASGATIRHNVLTWNTTSDRYLPTSWAGSAIWCDGCDVNLYRNLVHHSWGPACVGLISANHVKIVNNTIANNSHGGLWLGFCDVSSQILIKNNVIYTNSFIESVPDTVMPVSDTLDGYGLYFEWCEEGDLVITYNDIFGHRGTGPYDTTDWQVAHPQGWMPDTAGKGNISQDPLFADQPGEDYHLTLGSPCINTGDSSDTVPPLGGTRIDMGAYEYPLITECGNVNGDEIINVGDLVYLVAYLYRGGPPPCSLRTADVNLDGVANVGDVVYLVSYLYREGPPPCEGGLGFQYANTATRHPSFARLWLSGDAESKAGRAKRTRIRGTLGVEAAGIELAVEYQPSELTITPVLPAHLQGLQVYHSQKDGLLKLGVVDIYGKSHIPSGKDVELIILQIDGGTLESLSITRAAMFDLDAIPVPVKIITEEEKEELRPSSFALFQNYPNPFNPETQIRYGLQMDCHVKVAVYNILGQRVRVLVDEHQTAGYKEVNWDGRDEEGVELASGIYFYRIQAADFVDSKKMLLLK